VKRLSGVSNQTVTSLLLVPALIGLAGMLVNGWHPIKPLSDACTPRSHSWLRA
jgi:hypothetical protein